MSWRSWWRWTCGLPRGPDSRVSPCRVCCLWPLSSLFQVYLKTTIRPRLFKGDANRDANNCGCGEKTQLKPNCWLALSWRLECNIKECNVKGWNIKESGEWKAKMSEPWDNNNPGLFPTGLIKVGLHKSDSTSWEMWEHLKEYVSTASASKTHDFI